MIRGKIWGNLQKYTIARTLFGILKNSKLWPLKVCKIYTKKRRVLHNLQGRSCKLD